MCARRRPTLALRAVILALASLVPWSAPALADPPTGTDDTALRSYLSANGLLNRGMYELATAEYREFLSAHADHEKAATARYGLGVALFRLKDYDAAATELDKLSKATDFAFAAEASLVLGQCELARGRFPEAAASFQRVVREHASHPSAPDAAALLSESWYRAGEFEAAEKAAAGLAESSPESPALERAQLFAGLAAIAKQDDQSAAGHFSALIERFPKGPLAPQARLLFAQCKHRLGETADAERAYRAVIKSDDAAQTPDGLLGLGSLLRDRGKPAEAGKVLDRLLADFPESRAAKSADLERGRVWFDQGDFDRAAESFAKARAREADRADGGDDDGQAAYWLAKCDLRADRAAQAADRLARAISDCPKSRLLPEMAYDRGVALLRANRPDEAAAALTEFRSRYPDHAMDAQALRLLATIEHQQRRYDRSLALCREFAEKYPKADEAPAIAFIAAEDLLLSGSADEAIAAYRAFLDQYAGSEQAPEARFRLGLALYKAGQDDQARPLLEQVARARPMPETFRPALLALGDLHFQASRWKQAQAALTEFLAQDPDAAGADDAMLKLGLSLQRQGRHEEAIARYDRLLEHFANSPQRSQAQFERAQALLALGRTEEAASAFSGVIDTSADSRFAPHALLDLASLAMAAKKFDDAADLYARAAKAVPDAPSRVEALFQQAQALLAVQRFDAAADALREVASDHSHPRAAQAAAQRAIAVSRQHHPQEALALIDESLSTSPGPDFRQSLLYEKAGCLRELGRPEDAATALRSLIDDAAPAAGDDASLRTHAAVELAEIEEAAGHFGAAGDLLRTALNALAADRDAAPSDLREHAAYRLGVCVFRADQPRQAADAMDTFLAEFPQSTLAPSALMVCGESLLKLGRHESAATHLQRLVDDFPADPSCASALLRLGECHAALQHWPESQKAFDEHLSRFSESDLWFQARFGQGWALENEGKPEGAIAAYRQVIERHQGPTAARAQFQIGECLFAQGKHDEAARELLKVDILYAYPEWSAAALYEAGRCFEAMSKPADAKAQFQRVLDHFAATHWAELSGQRLAALPSAPAPDGPVAGAEKAATSGPH
jgi:TolA-binding protein